MNVHYCPDEKHRLATGERGGGASRTVTFDSESLTIMLSITPGSPDRIRLDGWLAPAGRHAVELRTSGGPRATTADHEGRFVLDDVSHGLAQLVVRLDGRAGWGAGAGDDRGGADGGGADGGRRAGVGGAAAPVVTPAIVV
jgi:hypothetical protein